MPDIIQHSLCSEALCLPEATYISPNKTEQNALYLSFPEATALCRTSFLNPLLTLIEKNLLESFYVGLTHYKFVGFL